MKLKLLIPGLFLITSMVMLPLGGLAFAANTTPNPTENQLFQLCNNPTYTNSPVCKERNPKTNPVVRVIKVAADIVAIATGAAAVVVIIISGFTMITSAGNTEAVANSRKRLVAALVGLVIVALAWTVISFVIDRFIK